MRDRILKRLTSMFDQPVIQNNLRGLWVEAMVAELLGSEWSYTGVDWSAWDFQREDGCRLEVKQSARLQSWGASTSAPRFGIAMANGHWAEDLTYIENHSGKRLADVYVFAWHDGLDQRVVEDWSFFVVPSDRLPPQQKTIGLSAVQKLAAPVKATELSTILKNF